MALDGGGARRPADRRIPIPTRFITTIVAVIFIANVATLATVMIGNTESPMYSSVISRPDHGLTRLMTGLLHGVRPLDPTTYGTVTLVVVAVALAASYLPARRAAAITPMTALRSD